MKGLTQAEFAKRAGVTQTTVSKALRTGRLVLLPMGGIDPSFLATQWRAQPARAVAAPSSADAPAKRKPGRPMAKPIDDASAKHAASFAMAELQRVEALAGLRRLEYEQRANRLIEIEAARRVLFEAARGARDAWLNWPARVAPRLAAELGVEPDEALRVLTKLVHDQLFRLADASVDLGAGEP